jgi:hypothetical protein
MGDSFPEQVRELDLRGDMSARSQLLACLRGRNVWRTGRDADRRHVPVIHQHTFRQILQQNQKRPTTLVNTGIRIARPDGGDMSAMVTLLLCGFFLAFKAGLYRRAHCRTSEMGYLLR